VRPDHGGRLELRLERASETCARYLLTLLTAEAEVSCEVAIEASADRLDLGEWRGGAPPVWLQGYAHAVLRSVQRTKASGGAWPRRLTRWRPAPKA